MKKTIFAILCILFFYPIQDIKSQTNDFNSGAFNVGIGAIIGGIGAVLNKKKNQNTKKVFFKGFREGALGGYLVFESKRLIREFARKENYIYAWSSKLINSAGNSIIENAAENNKFSEKWSFTFGFNRFEISTKEKIKVNYKIMPLSLYSTFYYSLNGRFDLKETLKTGHFIFKTAKVKSFIPNIGYADGTTFTNNILILKNLDFGKYKILSHEIIHSYQYENLSAFNAYFNKTKYHLNKHSKILTMYNKYFYTDFNYLLFTFIHQTQVHNNSYYSQPYEKEAFYFSN